MAEKVSSASNDLRNKATPEKGRVRFSFSP